MILIGFYIALIVILPAALAVRMRRTLPPTPPLSDQALRRLTWAVAGGLVVTNLILIAPYFLFPNSIWGESESNLIADAALGARGVPLYSGPDGIGAHALLYGPMTYYPFMLVFAVGGGLLAAKIAAAIAGTAGLTLIAREIFTRSPDDRARGLLILAVGAFLLPHASALLIAKGDAWVLLYSALPLLTRRSRCHGAVIGLCAGAALSTKIPAVLAFLPYLIDALQRHGRSALWQSLAAGAATTLAAHLALGNGLRDYVALLQLAGHHPIAPQLAAASALTLILPGAVYGALLRQQGMALVDVGLLVAAALLLIPAAKIGAGSYHLAVLMAPLAMRLCDLYREPTAAPRITCSDAVFALLLASLVGAVQIQAIGGFVERARNADRNLSAALPVFAQLAPPFAIAPSHDGFQRLEAYLLVPSILAGADAPATVGALSDFHLAGNHIGPLEQSDMLDCRRTWLSAADAVEPWGAMSTYWTLQHDELRGEGENAGSLFNADFRARFRERFTDQHPLGPFTVWRCPTSLQMPDSAL